MPKTFIFLIIGLFFGTGAGFIIAAGSGAQLTGHDHNDPAAHGSTTGDHGADHSNAAHNKLTEADSPAPALTMTLHPDGEQSRNLQINVSNFRFNPEAVNGENAPGEGHAHIYLNGIKLARTYSPWFHIAGLTKGEHEVRVTLNANNHSQLAIKGQPVEVVQKLVIE